MNKLRVTIAGPIALAAVVSACREPAPTTVVENGSRREAVAVKDSRIRPEEKLLFDIEAKAPGFGGFYVDGDRRVHTWMKSSGDAELARNAIQRAFMDGTIAVARNSMPASFVAEGAQYTISELATWRDLIFDAVNAGQFKSAISLDMDERLNRVRFVVDGTQDLDDVRTEIDKLDIPLGAVSLQEGARPKEASAAFVPPYITDQADTVVGGLGISWTGPYGAAGGCTLGFTVNKNGGARFVTASHCSEFTWGNDGAVMRNAAWGRQIGYETEDPAGYFCGIRTCRGSDANMSSYSPGIVGQVGLIARVTAIGGSLQWNTSSPYWIVSNVAQGNMYVGQPISRIGAVTGWTTGVVYNTCDDYFAPGNRTDTCQNDGTNGPEHGDSGGPIFFENGLGSGYVTLAGITVAKGGWPNSNLIFSSFSRVAGNLGLTAANVIDPFFLSPPPVITGAVSGGYPSLTWPAVSGAASYRLYRQWYRYSTGQGSNGFEDLGNVNSPFSGDYLAVDAYTGTTLPSFSTEGYVAYYLMAYNSIGVASPPSVIKYFRLAP